MKGKQKGHQPSFRESVFQNPQKMLGLVAPSARTRDTDSLLEGSPYRLVWLLGHTICFRSLRKTKNHNVSSDRFPFTNRGNIGIQKGLVHEESSFGCVSF